MSKPKMVDGVWISDDGPLSPWIGGPSPGPSAYNTPCLELHFKSGRVIRVFEDMVIEDTSSDDPVSCFKNQTFLINSPLEAKSWSYGRAREDGGLVIDGPVPLTPALGVEAVRRQQKRDDVTIIVGPMGSDQ